LEPELQELVLDEMEQLASNPPPEPARTVRRDFVRDIGNVRHNVFLRGVVDRRSKRITIVGLVYLRRPQGRG
jgi:hypothetical protein